MDMQKMFDMMSDAARTARSDYHVTLGKMIELLGSVPPATPVKCDTGSSLGQAMSYRGYYADLAFQPSTNDINAGEFLMVCKSALGREFTGYKGGEFLMGEDTPLWLAAYGDMGRAIVGFITGETILLMTKDLH